MGWGIGAADRRIGAASPTIQSVAPIERHELREQCLECTELEHLLDTMPPRAFSQGWFGFPSQFVTSTVSELAEFPPEEGVKL